MSKPYVVGAVVALLLIAGLYGWFKANEAKLPVNQSPVGFRLIDQMEREGMPDFTLEKIDGGTLQLSSLKGKVMILNFWASWCNPCVEEFPSMMNLVEKMNGDVVVVAVSTDDERKDIEAFLKAFKLPRPNFYVVWDKDKTVMRQYGIEKVPESFLVNKEGKLSRKVLGIENWASANAIEYFQMLLSGQPTHPDPATGK